MGLIGLKYNIFKGEISCWNPCEQRIYTLKWKQVLFMEWVLKGGGEVKWSGWRRVNMVDVLYILVWKCNKETLGNGFQWGGMKNDGRCELKQVYTVSIYEYVTKKPLCTNNIC
jgi:hypothetical protein